MPSDMAITSEVFQSTLSVRRATPDADVHSCPHQFQSTLSVRRATLLVLCAGVSWSISIHALREESDVLVGEASVEGCISIHALREESDTDGVASTLRTEAFDFNPRSP